MSKIIIRRSRKEVIFDISRIAAAVSKAFVSIQLKLDCIIQNSTRALLAFADTLEEYRAYHIDQYVCVKNKYGHNLARFMAHYLFATRKCVSDIVKIISHRPRTPAATYHAAALCFNANPLTITEYTEHLFVFQRINLFRRQDRGDSEPVSDNDNFYNQ